MHYGASRQHISCINKNSSGLSAGSVEEHRGLHRALGSTPTPKQKDLGSLMIVRCGHRLPSEYLADLSYVTEESLGRRENAEKGRLGPLLFGLFSRISQLVNLVD